MKRSTLLYLFLTLFTGTGAFGQTGDTAARFQKDTTTNRKGADTIPEAAYFRSQRDLIDLFLIITGRNPDKRLLKKEGQSPRLHISAAPAIQYSLETGLGVNFTGNAGFYLVRDSETNLSSVLASVTGTQNQQLICPIQSSIWTKDNKYNFVGDWRYMEFPEKTYGLGGHTTDADAVDLNYNYLRFYQYILRKVAKDFFIGPGYQLDIHYDIQQLNLSPGEVTPFDAYGYKSSSYSSGVALDVLYDTRKNSINPEGGSFYGNLVVRQNLTFLGSDQDWNSVLVDVRKYFSVGHKNNVLAFWSFDWFTLSGKPPYLDLPSTAWDTYDNTGRGYVQSRFRGKSLLDLEGEFRFGILNDGLLGGVIFANCQSVSDPGTGQFNVFWPGAGAGLRIKFNKFSKTNICVDYGFGLNGSNGLFLNLGEVF
ncbi:BamA/TamA family outer membrane protein [Dinghuibacter silviterrae]|uniref:Surface antigen-like protein n=1 Tax=Dinghuibacter silviterrae TaxID=1539049 RepID=A0A4R8DPA5_9BACT|nr:hypothetical protein [Dinghuibacter silviterrae]TDW99903.1 hypothetical protein EDB95_0918 [Dinghuibacter silviterrae]